MAKVKHTANLWAVWNYKEKLFCGKYCWHTLVSPLDDGSSIVTFQTRKMARLAIQRMRSYADVSRPIKVQVTITIK